MNNVRPAQIKDTRENSRQAEKLLALALLRPLLLPLAAASVASHSTPLHVHPYLVNSNILATVPIATTHPTPLNYPTHHAVFVDGDVRGHKVDVAPFTVHHRRVGVRRAEARPSARDEPTQPADPEGVAEVPDDMLHEGAADLVAADTDEGDAVLGVEASKLFGSW